MENGIRFSVIKIIFTLYFCLLTTITFALQIKEPNAAGSFYPNNSNELSVILDTFLNNTGENTETDKISALISPHAGYVYSGQIAAYGYNTLRNKEYDCVIILGPSHRQDFAGLATGSWKSYKTPLGEALIDQDMIERLLSQTDLLKINNDVFGKEHSIEVQIPFIQKVLPDTKIVPILTGKLTLEEIIEFSRLLVKLRLSNGKINNILLIASTDLSHYFSYENCKSIDQFTLREIESLDIKKLKSEIDEGGASLCGDSAVMILMNFAKELNLNPKTLKYANSGDITGDKSKVVGYSSVVFLDNDINKEKKMFSKSQKKILLELARNSILRYLSKKVNSEQTTADPEFNKKLGAFVTLRKNEELRGCIGNIYPSKPLNDIIREMAIAAATSDPRFMPVTVDELKEIDIEISVLSVPKLISDIKDIEMGIHGVIVKNGFNSGVFLPQVATETGWTKEEFLNNLCEHKANLPKDAWKNLSDTKIYTFNAEVFSEKEIE